MRRLLPLTALLLALTACSGDADAPAAARPDPLPAHSTGSPTAATSDYPRYVAIGDSYTAAPLVPLTDTSSTCLRSSVNYPALVAQAMPGTRLADVSCSGASTTEVTRRQAGQGGSVPPQLDAVTRGTDLVTIGLGGNDEQLFASVLGRCLQAAAADPDGSPCTDSYDAAGLAQLDTTFDHITTNVAGVVEAVRGRAPRARVLVVGYPQIVPARGTCDLLPLARGDYAFAREANRRLTEAVQAAAERSGAEYVDVWRASAGHDVCGAEPWINGPVSSPQTALAFHPFAVEQEAVADLVLDILR